MRSFESFYFTIVLKQQRRTLKSQKEATDNLLQSILPKFIIDQLKVNYLSQGYFGGPQFHKNLIFGNILYDR